MTIRGKPPSVSREQAFDQTFFENTMSSAVVVIGVMGALLCAALLFWPCILAFCAFGSIFFYLWRCHRARQWYRLHDAQYNLEPESGEGEPTF